MRNGDLAHTLGLAGPCAVAGGIGLDGAGNDFDEGHLTDEGVGDGLEADGCERAVRVAGQFDFVAVLVSRGLAGLGAGGGAEVDEAVQQLVDAFELVGGAGVNGIDVTVGDALEQTGQRFDFGEGFAFEIFFHELVAGGGNGFIEHVSVGVELVGLGHVDFDRLAVLVLVALVLGQVDEVTDLTFFDERDDDRAKLVAVDFLHGFEDVAEVGVLSVGLVDDEDLGQVADLGGVEGLLGANVIRGALCVHNDEHAARGTCRFGKSAREIEKTGSIYQIDFDVIPLKACNGALQGRLTFLLLRVIVHDGGAVCDLAETLGGACRVQHGFAQSGLTTSGMTRNCNVAYVG